MNNLIQNNQNEVSITLKEITDLIDVRHDRAMLKVDELSKEDGFGTVSKIDIVYNGKGQTIQTYILDKFQAITVGAKLNNSLLIKLVKKIEELEKQNQKILTPQEQIILLAQGSVKQEERLSIVEQKIDNEILLTSAQKHHLRNLVNKKVFSLKEQHNFSDDFIRKGYQRVWKKLKNHFIVSSYMEIPKVKFDEAVSMVDGVLIEEIM